MGSCKPWLQDWVSRSTPFSCSGDERQGRAGRKGGRDESCSPPITPPSLVPRNYLQAKRGVESASFHLFIARANLSTLGERVYRAEICLRERWFARRLRLRSQANTRQSLRRLGIRGDMNHAPALSAGVASQSASSKGHRWQVDSSSQQPWPAIEGRSVGQPRDGGGRNCIGGSSVCLPLDVVEFSRGSDRQYASRL